MAVIGQRVAHADPMTTTHLFRLAKATTDAFSLPVTEAFHATSTKFASRSG
jgi:hypothetical protein